MLSFPIEAFILIMCSHFPVQVGYELVRNLSKCGYCCDTHMLHNLIITLFNRHFKFMVSRVFYQLCINVDFMATGEVFLYVWVPGRH